MIIVLALYNEAFTEEETPGGWMRDTLERIGANTELPEDDDAEASEVFLQALVNAGFASWEE